MSAVNYCYQVFGLVLASDIPLPGLTIADSSSAPGITISFKTVKHSPAALNLLPVVSKSANRDEWDERLKISITDDQSLYRLHYQNGHDFLIDAAGDNIWVMPAEKSAIEESLFYLLGPVLGTAIKLKGLLCLHASAVAIADHAVILTGPSGGGKSTTAAALVHKGYPLITEDLLVLKPVSGGYLACPGYPRLRLWRDSADYIFSNNVELERLTPDWDKHSLDLNRHQLSHTHTPVPLALIYTRSSDSAPVLPVINNVSPKDALITLAANTYPRHVHAFTKSLRARELQLIEKLVREIPLRQIAYRPGFEYLDALCTTIVEDVKNYIRSATNNVIPHTPALT